MYNINPLGIKENIQQHLAAVLQTWAELELCPHFFTHWITHWLQHPSKIAAHVMLLWLSPFDQTSTSCANPSLIFQIQRLIQPIWLTVTTIRLALGWPSGAGVPNHLKASETPGSGLSDDTAKKKHQPHKIHNCEGGDIITGAGFGCCWTAMLSAVPIKFQSFWAFQTVWLIRTHLAVQSEPCSARTAHSTVHDLICLPTPLLLSNVSMLVAVFLFVLCMCPHVSVFLYRVSAGQVYNFYILNTVSLELLIFIYLCYWLVMFFSYFNKKYVGF